MTPQNGVLCKKVIMKKITAILFSVFITLSAFSQVPSLNNLVRNNPPSAAKSANALDASKSFSTSGTDTYSITTGLGQYTGALTYAAGDMFTITIGNANTSTTVTLNVDTEGAVALKNNDGSDPDIGSLCAGCSFKFRHNGTNFRMVGSSGGGTTGTVEDVTGTSPIVITGVSTVTPNVTINNSAADGSTKGAASFTANDFDASSGNISIDYTNGQEATTGTKGFLTATDWNTFNNKQATGLSYLLATGGTASGVNTFTSNAASQFNWAGTWTSTATNQFHAHYGGTLTARGTASDILHGYVFNPTLVAGAATQSLNTVSIIPTYTPGAFSPSTYPLYIGDAGAGTYIRFNANPTMTTMAMQFRNNSGTAQTMRADAAGNNMGVQFGWGATRLELSNGIVNNAVTDTSAPSIARLTGSSGNSGINYIANMPSTGATLHQMAGTINSPNNGTFSTVTTPVTFTAASGTAFLNSFTSNPTYNLTGTYVGTAIGFYHNPTLTSVTGLTHYAFLGTSGNFLLGASSITANTRFDVRGTGTTTNILGRFADSSNTSRWSLQDNGDITAVGKYILTGTAMSGSSLSSNFLNITGTMPGTMTNTTAAVSFLISGAGTSTQNNMALRVDYSGGYTGSSPSAGGNIINRNAGTNTTAPTISAIVGNIGNGGFSEGSTGTGHNYGLYGEAQLGILNVAVYGHAQTDKNSGMNIGLAAQAANNGVTPNVIGAYIGLESSATALPTNRSAGIIVNNGSTTRDIARFEDNGTSVVTIADGGATTFGTTNAIVGTATNNSATAGHIGEYVSSLIAVGSAVSLTTATPANVTSISLTAGDWDVEGNINFTETTATVTARSGGVTSTTATIPTDGSEVYNGSQTVVITSINSITSSRKRFSLSGTTTVYLVTSATFSAGTVAAFGSITARRVR